MADVYFTKEHEWISVSGAEATVGITAYAQEHLGDLVYVEPPEVGKKLVNGKEAAVVESVKAASDVYAPVSGEVTATNKSVVDQPGLVNESPEEKGWLFKLRLSDPGELKGLMDRAAYEKFCATLG
jgi:glycine cleavage system H protein